MLSQKVFFIWFFTSLALKNTSLNFESQPGRNHCTMSGTKPLKEDKATDDVAPAGPVEGPDYVKLTITMVVMLAIGTGTGYVSLLPGSSEIIDSKIQTIRSMDLQWFYLALVLLGRTIALLNFVPMAYKRGIKGNIRSNPFFFETADASKTTVVYKEEGPKGIYNRSNRSVQHLVENSGAFFASLGPVGWVFPRQTLGVVAVFCVGRIVHQKGYAKGYGKHAPGFALSLLSILTLEGLAFVAFLKGAELL